ncbi:MAG: Gfo/Idh/MocA family oxidoreductase [Phycisphaerales bacterium]|nr:Gfo/Idh/MocA family oxidoreductase [Phycisphaerales bacterium]
MTKIRTAMVGGGIGGFIGEIHRMAMRLDDRFELIAGALSSDETRAMESAKDLGIRGYPTWLELFEKEQSNIDCVVIVTPNDSHAEIATAALSAGYHVMLDKPMTRTLEEAIVLAELAQQTDCVFSMTYSYTGYPMVRQMRQRILAGDIGAVRTVSVDYRQGWLAEPIEKESQKQASWRTDPKQSGAGALGDIGSHAEQLARFTTGLSIKQVRGDVHSLVRGRKVDDHACVQVKMEQGVVGDLVCSQVCTGERNHVSVRVWGEKGTLAWSHDACDALKFTAHDGTETINYCNANRAPSGHPAGFVEAFANIYKDMADKMQGVDVQIIDAKEGLASMMWIDAVLRSQETKSWCEV